MVLIRSYRFVPEHHVVIVAAYETKMLMNHHLNLVQSLKASSSKKMVVDYENRKDNEFIPPDEQSVVAESSVELGFDSTDFTEDSEGSTYLSSVRRLVDSWFGFLSVRFLSKDSFLFLFFLSQRRV